VAERKTADSRRREIADAALRVIAEQGLGRFTALAIAREVGVSDAALFRHFQTKDDIVLAAIDRLEEILFAGFPPAGRDALERLGNFFRQRVAVIEGNPGVARLVASDSLAQAAPAVGVARVADFRRRSVRFIRTCLADAAREGLLAGGLEPAEAEVLVIGAILALTQARGLNLRRSQDGGLADGTWRALERLLRRS
jgi:AcrR family transcriptional regulator